MKNQHNTYIDSIRSKFEDIVSHINQKTHLSEEVKLDVMVMFELIFGKKTGEKLLFNNENSLLVAVSDEPVGEVCHLPYFKYDDLPNAVKVIEVTMTGDDH